MKPLRNNQNKAVGFIKDLFARADFFKKVQGVFLYKILGILIGFAGNIILARYAGAGNYGLYSLALSWVAILILFGKTGFDTLVLKFLPEYKNNAQSAEIKGLFKTSFFSVFVSSACVAVIFYFLIDGYGKYDEAQKQFFKNIFCFLPAYSLLVLTSGWFRAMHKVSFALLPGLLISFFVPLAAVINFHYFGGEQVLFAIGGTYTLASILLLGLFGFKLFRMVTPGKQQHGSGTKYLFREWLWVAISFSFVDGVQMLLSQTDIIMLGLFESPENIGYYRAAFRVTSIMSFGLIAVNFVLASEISKLYFSNKLKELQHLVTLCAKLLSVYTLFTLVALIAGGGFLLQLFGDDFRTFGYPALLVLVFGQAVNVLSGAVGFLMSMTGHHNDALLVMGISLGINIVLNYSLIPVYGILGAAIATAIATIFRNVYMAFYVRKRLNIRPTIFY